LAKDLRHQNAVEEAGCDFIPLVVETFGVRFAMLRIIADRTTARSGASTKLARKHFILQQLSVSLWMNNVHMISRFWALKGENSDFVIVKQLL